MKHKISFNRLGRRAGQRKALVKSMIMSLLKHERLTTTKAKAMEIRRFTEKMITKARVDTVHNRRIVGKVIQDKAILDKLFTEIGPRYIEKTKGGYTRVLKLGYRHNDSSEMAVVELIDRKIKERKKKEKKEKKAESA
ncbi:MAG: 50S ribosomal protein L17 [Spirochaetales bacterium]|nr:MAG: 50S ribosomal protein L17 [Spirochaetales bacterium]